MSNAEEQLHQADIESVARRLVELACSETQTRHGALFLLDSRLKGLTVDFHRVEGVIVALPGSGALLRPRRDGRSNGIALTCFERGTSYVCNDTFYEAVRVATASGALAGFVHLPYTTEFTDDTRRAWGEVARAVVVAQNIGEQITH